MSDRGRPLRVLCLTEVALGHNVFVQNLQRHLAADGAVEAEWVTIRPEQASGFRRFPVFGAHQALLGSALAMRAVAARRGWPDALFFHTPTIAQLALPLMARLPTLVSLDSTQRQFGGMAGAYGARPPSGGTAGAAVARLNGAVYRAAAALLPWSAWAAGSLIRDYGASPARVVVNPPGVELPTLVPKPPSADDEPVRLLFVGGDFARKGGWDLLATLQSLSLPWELHVVTRDAVPAHSNVRVYGALANDGAAYRALFQRCDVFVLPTRADCHSIASIEGMAAGLPVLSTTVGGIPEIVDDGETGYLVPPGDRERLRERLATLLGDPTLRRRMGAAGRQRAERLFRAGDRATTVTQTLLAACGRPSRSDAAPAWAVGGVGARRQPVMASK